MVNRPGMEIGSHKVTIVSLRKRKERKKCRKHGASCTLSLLVVIIIDLRVRLKNCINAENTLQIFPKLSSGLLF